MNLRYISIKHIYNRNPDDYTLFAWKIVSNSRFICNWMSKEVRKLHIDTGPINMFCFTQSPEHEECKLSGCFKSLECFITISTKEQSVLKAMSSLTDRYEFYLSLLEKGYRAASTIIPFHIEQLLELHDKFRVGGYRNEWLFKKIIIREYGLYVYLKCYFTTFDFHMDIEAYDLKQTILIAKGTVFQTCPDELFYQKDIRSIRVDGPKLLILNFLGETEIEVDLDALVYGRILVRYIDSYCLNWTERHESDQSFIKRMTW